MADIAKSNQPSADQLGYEPDKIHVRPILTFTVVLVTVVLITCFALVAVMSYFSTLDSERQQLQPPLFADDKGQYAGPRLQESPTLDMQRMRDEAADRLNSYGWVDREANIAHIPIERAIKLFAQSSSLHDTSQRNKLDPTPEPHDSSGIETLQNAKTSESNN